MIKQAFNYLRTNKLFTSRFVNVCLIIMALIYVTFISRAVIQSNETPTVPYSIESIKLLDTNVSTDQAIFIIVAGEITNRHCEDAYVLGSVISGQTNIVLFDKVTVLTPEQIAQALTNKTPLKMNIGILKAGKYLFRAEFHNICSGKSFVVLAPLVSFEVK